MNYRVYSADHLPTHRETPNSWWRPEGWCPLVQQHWPNGGCPFCRCEFKQMARVQSTSVEVHTIYICIWLIERYKSIRAETPGRKLTRSLVIKWNTRVNGLYLSSWWILFSVPPTTTSNEWGRCYVGQVVGQYFTVPLNWSPVFSRACLVPYRCGCSLAAARTSKQLNWTVNEVGGLVRSLAILKNGQSVNDMESN